MRVLLENTRLSHLCVVLVNGLLATSIARGQVDARDAYQEILLSSGEHYRNIVEGSRVFDRPFRQRPSSTLTRLDGSDRVLAIDPAEQLVTMPVQSRFQMLDSAVRYHVDPTLTPDIRGLVDLLSSGFLPTHAVQNALASFGVAGRTTTELLLATGGSYRFVEYARQAEDVFNRLRFSDQLTRQYLDAVRTNLAPMSGYSFAQQPRYVQPNYDFLFEQQFRNANSLRQYADVRYRNKDHAYDVHRQFADLARQADLRYRNNNYVYDLHQHFTDMKRRADQARYNIYRSQLLMARDLAIYSVARPAIGAIMGSILPSRTLLYVAAAPIVIRPLAWEAFNGLRY